MVYKVTDKTICNNEKLGFAEQNKPEFVIQGNVQNIRKMIVIRSNLP